MEHMLKRSITHFLGGEKQFEGDESRPESKCDKVSVCYQETMVTLCNLRVVHIKHELIFLTSQERASQQYTPVQEILLTIGMYISQL